MVLKSVPALVSKKPSVAPIPPVDVYPLPDAIGVNVANVSVSASGVTSLVHNIMKSVSDAVVSSNAQATIHILPLSVIPCADTSTENNDRPRTRTSPARIHFFIVAPFLKPSKLSPPAPVPCHRFNGIRHSRPGRVHGSGNCRCCARLHSNIRPNGRIHGRCRCRCCTRLQSHIRKHRRVYRRRSGCCRSRGYCRSRHLVSPDVGSGAVVCKRVRPPVSGIKPLDISADSISISPASIDAV